MFQFRWIVFCIIAGALATTPTMLSGCNKSSSSLQVNDTKPFQFDPKEISEMTVARFDPESDQSWVTHLKKKQTGSPGENPTWEISSAPADQALLDRMADDILLNHLVDLLPSIQIEDKAPNGPLDSFGLQPPRFALKWKVGDKEMGFTAGTAVEKRSGRFYFSTLEQFPSRIMVAKGPALEMLKEISSFQALRKKTWTQILPDEIDEIELSRGGKLYLYAQREGDRWTDRQHRKILKDVDTLLHEVLTAEAMRFVDNHQENSAIRQWIQAGTSQSISLKDRFGHSSLLEIREKNGTLYGINTSRPQGAFVLNRKILSGL